MSLTPHTQRGARAGPARAVARGLLAVLICLLGAVDALITSHLGIPRLTWLVRTWTREIADEYRRCYHGARDADVVHDQEEDE